VISLLRATFKAYFGVAIAAKQCIQLLLACTHSSEMIVSRR